MCSVQFFYRIIKFFRKRNSEKIDPISAEIIADVVLGAIKRTSVFSTTRKDV
jgi:hypothetical protein